MGSTSTTRRHRRSRVKRKEPWPSPTSSVPPPKRRRVSSRQDSYPLGQIPAVLEDSGTQEPVTITSKSSSNDLNDLKRHGFLSLSCEVRDVSRTEHHLPNARKFLEKLDAAWKPRWQTRLLQQYQKVSCLLMRWEEEIMSVKDETDELASVFRDTYNFGVEEFLLPTSKDRYIKVVQKVHTFINENDREGNLMILYYGGHAEQNRVSQPVWYSGSVSNPVNLRSDVIFARLEDVSADALLLVDSCQALPKGFESVGIGAVSVIAATGFEPSVVGIAPVPGPHSFTRSLIDELIVLSMPTGSGQPPPSFSDVDLHDRIISRLMHYAEAPLRNEDGSFMRDEDGHHMMELPRRRTPIHRFLTRGQTARPICLAPLPRSDPARYQTPASHRSPQTQDGSHSDSSPDAPALVPYALIKVALDKNGFEKADSLEWAKWILKAPSNAVDVHVTTGEVTIESFYQSCSSMLIVKLPVYVWSWMEKDPSITFLGYVSGDNQAASINEKITREVEAEIKHQNHPGDTCETELRVPTEGPAAGVAERCSSIDGDSASPSQAGRVKGYGEIAADHDSNDTGDHGVEGRWDPDVVENVESDSMEDIQGETSGDEGIDTKSQRGGLSWRDKDSLIENLPIFPPEAIPSVVSKHQKPEFLALGGEPERDTSPRNASKTEFVEGDATRQTKDLEEVTDGSEPTLAMLDQGSASGSRPTDAVQKPHITTSTEPDQTTAARYPRKRQNAKLPIATSTEPSKGPSRLPWACPFFKLDPRKYHRCEKFQLSRIADIRQHIMRKHKQTSYCPRCHRIFEDSDSRASHLHSSSCEIRYGAEPPPGWRPELSISRSPEDDRERWYQLWTILFHDAPKPHSPFLSPDKTALGLLADVIGEFFMDGNSSAITWVNQHVGPNANIQDRSLPGQRLEELIFRVLREPDS